MVQLYTAVPHKVKDWTMLPETDRDRLLTQHEYHIVIQSDTNRDLGMIIAEQLPMVTT